MGEGQSLLALTVVKNALHECRLQGCNVSLPFDKIKEHEEKCDWRLVMCPGCGHDCTAMVPLCTVMTHVQNCADCDWPPKQDNDVGLQEFLQLTKERAFNGKCVKWNTNILQLEQGSVFFVRLSRKEGDFKVDVVLKGSKDDCKGFMVKASIVDPVSKKSMFRATFQPR